MVSTSDRAGWGKITKWTLKVRTGMFVIWYVAIKVHASMAYSQSTPVYGLNENTNIVLKYLILRTLNNSIFYLYF